jgi:hypothetical protein
MNRTIAILTSVIVLFFSLECLAIQKVSKNGKKDSAKANTTAAETEKKFPAKEPIKEQKPAPKPDMFVPPPKDKFIDRDGDGINDNIQKSKPPEIKREQPPKIERKEPPKKIETKEKNSKSSGKRAKK